MNASNPVNASASARVVRFLSTAALLAASAVTTVLAESAATPQEPKTNFLFMGANIAVEKNREFVPVRDVEGGAFVLDINGKRVLVPMAHGTISMQVNPELKLTEAAAVVTNLKAERAYTAEQDPNKKFAREQPGGAGGAAAGIAAGDVFANQMNQSAAQAGANGASGPGAGIAQANLSSARSQVGSSANSYNNALLAANSDFNSAGVFAARLQAELDKKLFDAVELNFEVSAEKPYYNPYIVIIASFRESAGKPGEVKTWIYAQALDPLGPEPQKVHILRGGFPPGFELDNYQVHFYNKGMELATNVAPKRVALTRDEAFQYILIEYVSGHKNATLPAVPAMGKLPADLRTRLASGQYAQPFYVKVSKNGQVVDTFLDESCSQKADDPYVVALVKGICFKPALNNGKPVEGISRVKLSELSL